MYILRNSTLFSLLLISKTLSAQNVDIAINISGSATSLPGGSITYTVYVTNNGPSDASNVNLVAQPGSNFTISSLSCQNSQGNNGSSVCPVTMNSGLLQSTGIVIPSIPYGSSAIFTITGTGGALTGTIQFLVTASVTGPDNDLNFSNNNVTYTTQLVTNFDCGQSTYEINIPQTVAQNTVAADGGVINLVYHLVSGNAIEGLGNSFTLPLTYSDLRNQHGVDNRWASLRIENNDIILGATTIGDSSTGSIFTSLPVSNKTIIGHYDYPLAESVLLHDRAISELLSNNTLQPLGTFDFAIGDIPLPTNVRVEDKRIIVRGWGTANFSLPELYSGYWFKPMIQHTTQEGANDITHTPEIAMEFGQSYGWRYTAYRALGRGIANNRRGVIIKSGSQITFSIEPRDYGNLPTTGSTNWPLASSRIEATDLSVARTWLGSNNGYPNISCADNLHKNDGLSITGVSPIAGNGSSALPFIINAQDQTYSFHVSVDGNGSASTAISYGIWYDVNGNGNFNDPDDIFASGNGTHNNGFTYIVPFTLNTGNGNAGATDGAIRVVATSENINFTKNQNGEVHVLDGEVEDYYVSYLHPLALTLLHFDIFNKNNTNILKWTISNEQNSSGFEIERSSPNHQWTKIGFINSALNSKNDTETYSFSDKTFLPGKNLYRLKQIDNDNKTIYSSTVFINNIESKNVYIYPTSATSYINIVGLGKEVKNIIVADISGNIIKKANTFSIPDTRIDLSDLSSGTYLLILNNADRTSNTFRFLIR